MVLVSHDREFVFLKTRKTAGTSIEMLLEPFCAPKGHVVTEATPCLRTRAGIVGRRILPAPERRFFRRFFPDWRNHMAAVHVAKLLGPRRWNRYTKISSVRDPFDRMVSAFHWHTPDLDPARGIPDQFRDFLRGKWPNDDVIVSVDGRMVVDHFIRFEFIREDLAMVADRLGLEIDLGDLPHAKDHKARRMAKSIDAYYDDDAIQIVRDRMAWVFDNFDYPRSPTPSSSEKAP